MYFLALLLQDTPDPTVIRNLMAAMFLVMPIIIVMVLAIVIVPFWFICKKAGFSPWLAFLNVIPFGHLILLYVLAFSEWKVTPVPQVGWPTPLPPPPQPPYPMQPPPQG
jgi:hypothetical protein